MGCAGSSNNREPETVDYQHVSPFNASYPYPEATKGKVEIPSASSDREILNKINQMPKTSESSYTSLLEHLSQGAPSEAYHVRAIYLWIASAETRPPTPVNPKQKQKDKRPPEVTGDTPRGYLHMIKEGTGDRTTLFTIMCRRSGIPCVMIDGIGKSSQYNVGDWRNVDTRWTGVHVEGEWRLIHVEWGLKLRKRGRRRESDFYFMPDPEEFATQCHPEKHLWQLLDSPLTRKEFLNLPNLRPKFFDLGMMIVTPKTAFNKAVGAKANVEVTFPKKKMDSVRLSYKLICVSTPKEPDSDDASESERHKPVPSRLERYVFMNRKPSRYQFEIQLPTRGKYNFEILGTRAYSKSSGSTSSSRSDMNDNVEKQGTEIKQGRMERLCQFRFTCDKEPDDQDVEPLPDTPDIGWGPGPVCRQMGLIPLTHHEGQIYIKPGDLRDIRFRNVEDKEVQTTLVHNYLPANELENQVEQEDVGDETRVKVRIPENGQYALKIYTRDEGEREYREACNYLLRQQNRVKVQELASKNGKSSQRKYRDKMLRTRLEHHITEHTSERELRGAMDMFQCYNVPDHGEMKRAQYKLDNYWNVKTELNGAVMGRNKGVLNKWIEKAKASQYRPDLEFDIQRAERMQGNVEKLKGFLHPVARMDYHTIQEIRGYNRPAPVVHNVMKSTYTLLGEKQGLDDWNQIQYLMGKTGKESLQNRILTRSAEDVPLQDARDAEKYIQFHTLEQCRGASSGTATFYKWSKQFIFAVRQKKMEAIEREAAERDTRGRETYREYYNGGSHLGTRDSEREPVTFKGRTSTRTSEEHPFGIAEKDRSFSTDRKSEVSDNDKVERRKTSSDEKYPTFDDISKENTQSQEVTRKYFMNPTKLDQMYDTPISYAGFKPQ